ncbi:methionine--tRNA ligase, cytoplasmic isoform X2 [Belonocnema kinseyi]|uniref:methionine--tRNA ligase, cytoplasmic isoform X2 n=1 Tax=Belonocnema kinseyi TaxID=2817044 RepID=UPI00143D3FE9|nr:methionine--tRNA ligase, cytoplasmic isoform X2 [Belonocnema kinseyi]
MIVSTNEGNPNALKLVLAAKLALKPVTVKIVALNESTLGRLPVIEIAPGLELFSTLAAVDFLAPIEEESSIVGKKWLEWEITQLQPALVSYGGSGTLDTSHKPGISFLLNELNAALKDKKYLIKSNNDLSVVDACLWVTLWMAVAIPEVNLMLKEFAHIENWLKVIDAISIVQESLKVFKPERGVKGIACIQAASWFPLNLYTLGKQSKPASDTKAEDEKDMDLISAEELRYIQDSWTTSFYRSVEPTNPVPVFLERNVLVTSALPYVNNVPHLGNIIGCVLSADIFARYCRQRNYNTLFICGTDEYGTATETKALEEKMTPQEICDKFYSIHNDIYRWFNIGFDYFGRTTTAEQTEIVQDMFLRIKSQGYILNDSVDQLLCETCNRFLADRFVEGTCPGCKYEDARGDQCDGCGHLVNATELINPRCKVCNNKPVVKASTQFFLDLPKLQDKLKEWIESVDSNWSSVARAVTKPWLRDGLKPRCITRDLKWGIPVPLDGYRDKVFYVWFDAPLGYISITKRFTKHYEQWWKPTKDSNIHLYQFMAKDNVPFHAIMFPATLLAADDGYTLVNHIAATEYLNYEDTKFSKSRGIGVFGTDAIETGIPADVWRFYLAYIRPESQDSNFCWSDLATKNNSELLNNLGNFVNRALMFVEKNYNSKVPAMEPQEDDFTVLALTQRELTNYILCFSKTKIRDALKHVLAISKHGNQYMQFQQPWVKIKGTDQDKKKAGTVIGICCNLACLLSALLAPYMPSTAREIRDQLGMDRKEYGYIPDIVTTMLPAGHKLNKPTPLFTKIENQQVEDLRKKYAGKQESSQKSPEDIKTLEDKIAKQAQLVRDLKARQDKSVWQPAVDVLLRLKKQLSSLQTTESQPSKLPVNKKAAAPSIVPEQNGSISNSEDIKILEAAIAKQGLLVRELKSKEQKSVWQPQVDLLLKLKKQLADLTGTSTSDKKSKKRK